MQFLIYFFIGGAAAVANLTAFLALMAMGVSLTPSTALAFLVTAAANYFLCIALLFRHKARWSSPTEILVYLAVVLLGGAIDLGTTRLLWTMGHPAWLSKAVASLVGFIFNFIGRRFLVFPEKTPAGAAGARHPVDT
jgi:dolichol-phosphate mannosyltransferase